VSAVQTFVIGGQSHLFMSWARYCWILPAVQQSHDSFQRPDQSHLLGH